MKQIVFSTRGGKGGEKNQKTFHFIRPNRKLVARGVVTHTHPKEVHCNRGYGKG